jgi:long-subunit fatty acid transport protein
MTALRRHLLAALLGLVCLLGLFQLNPAVGFAERVNRDVALASTAVYVSLRAINAALSVAQEIELGGSLGVSASAQPMKVLEPVDDTVERVAAVVFGVAVLSGLLSVALAPVATLGAGLALVGLAGLALGAGAGAAGWRPPAGRRCGSARFSC